MWKLRDPLRAHDAASASIAELDARLAEGLVGLEEQIRLLETVPGIQRGSACAILVENSARKRWQQPCTSSTPYSQRSARIERAQRSIPM